MQELDQPEEVAETPELTATPTPVPTNTPRPELSDDPAELEALMIAIKQKLQNEESQESETVSTDESQNEPVPMAAMTPLPEPEPMKFSIWDNKKLIIEALPEHMFIQLVKESKPEETQAGQYDGEVCGVDEWGYPCHWYY